ncbi:MAG: NAD(P)/FAD-dependent oxidoreductase [Clostridiales bacterium]|nr:NAD(P)/FAD-dependent oxidoreductase [Clostridiales bacterium]
MANVVIIGNGPAGISASLYTTRAGIKTTVIGKDYGALGKASEIENYYGLNEPISGAELINKGIEGAKRLGAEIVKDEVLGISFEDKLTITTKNGKYSADGIIIATGTSRKSPKIKGLKELEGLGVSYCATCDAFFYRGRDVAVLGHSTYALHEAMELAATSNLVTILTNGKEPDFEIPKGIDNIKINTSKVKEISGDDIVEGVVFEDDSHLPISGLFVALGVAGSTDLARKIGAQIDGNRIVVDENMATNIPGLYAAGDCTGGLLQIAKAVYEGAKAGTEISKYLRKNDSMEAVKAANI